ncbi:CARDB domain-containing protein, partial [Cribrihabitans sp. XS_ASV171]
DVDTREMPFDGTYTLLVEGFMNAPDAREFTFNIYSNPLRSPISLTLEDVPAPDLVPSDFSVATDDPLETGGIMPLEWTLTNAGDLPVITSFNTRITVRDADGAILSDLVVPYDVDAGGEIAAGESLTRSADIRLPAGSQSVGDLNVTLRVDTENNVEEQNDAGDAETNNNLTLTATVVLAASPDLLARDVSISPASGWEDGETVTVDYTLANDGGKAASGAWTERLIVTNRNTNRVVLSQDLRVPGDTTLEAGATLERSVEFGWPEGIDGTGLFDFRIIIDALDEVAEANDEDTGETNNDTTTRV